MKNYPKTFGFVNRVDPVRERSQAERGFTLIELLVVVGIIAVLLGILIPSVKFARESSNTTRCLSNLRQIGTAITQYSMDNGDCLVPGDTWGQRDLNPAGSGNYPNPGMGSWADILVNTHYLSSPTTPYIAGNVIITGLPATRDSVLRCPNATESDSADPNGYPTTQTDGRGRFYSVRGSDLVGQCVFSWYAVNSAPRPFVSDLARPQTPFVTLPMGFMDAKGNPTSPLYTMHKFNQLKNSSKLPMIFDGVLMTNDDPRYINARHGNNQYTNILFGDSHCETLTTLTTWPDVNWYLQ